MNDNNDVLESAITTCNHAWDKLTGIWSKGIPHIAVKGKWIRTCIKCGEKEAFSKSGVFIGWYSTYNQFNPK